MKTNFTLTTAKYLLLALGLLLSHYVPAQVTVGSGDAAKSFSVLELSTKNVQGGLRLPHLSTDQRNELTRDNDDFKTNAGRPDGAALGLTIYNTTANCVEYWDGYKWVSLCLGSAEITFTQGGTLVDPTQPQFPAQGATKGPFLPKADPVCENTQQNPPYGFMLMTGSEYTSINVIDPSRGQFSITMDLNPTAISRTAILRVTDNCTGEYKEYVFSQFGDDSACTSSIVPDIKSNSTTELCQNGALYLYLDGYPSTGTFIWTLNGKEVGRGNNLSVTEPGRYVVYSNLIGCTNSKDITITRGADVAPLPVDFIVVGNNGVACGTNGTVELIVTNIITGTVTWYKDGQKQTSAGMIGTRIRAGKGNWFAVVENAGCMSRPTNTVTVVVNDEGGNIGEPAMKINDKTSGWSICKGSIMSLEVVSPQLGITYTWYINNDLIGVGNKVFQAVPSSDEFVIRLRATGTGCAKEALVVQNVGAGEAPNPPFITATNNDMLCGGSVTLRATNSSTATSYRWFKDGVEMAGQTGVSITVSTTGTYTVNGIAGGCSSILSGAKIISASDFATLTWVSHPSTANVGETKTYSVTMDFPQGATYNWFVTGAGGAYVTNGKETPSATINFTTAGEFIVFCSASNACGTIIGNPSFQEVKVSPNCTPAQINNTENETSDVKVGQSVTLSVSASGTAPLKYQWYSGTVGTTTTPLGTDQEYTPINNTTGTKLFWCRVIAGGTCTTPANSRQFTINVTQDPATYPLGKGTFMGKTCFDIATDNNGTNSCGTLTSRANQKTVFTIRTPQEGGTAPYSGVQVYTFIPTGTVSNVRFDFVDPLSGSIIQSFEADGIYTGNISTGTICKATAFFNPGLQGALSGLTRAQALKAKLYVIYNDKANQTGDDVKLELNLSFMDCACCGAETVNSSGTKTGWLTFMCHNLGADESLDPFVYKSTGDGVDGDIKGFLYQWGRQTDGHQKRTSNTTYTKATSNTPDNGNFILAWNPPYDWRSGDLNTSRWGNGSTAENMPKATNDPCPAGWKVPSQLQWASIFRGGTTSGAPNTATANKWEWTGNGCKVGDALYLPAAGNRFYTDGSLGYVGAIGLYWSSTVIGTDSYFLRLSSGSVYPANAFGRATGYSVRCVSE